LLLNLNFQISCSVETGIQIVNEIKNFIPVGRLVFPFVPAFWIGNCCSPLELTMVYVKVADAVHKRIGDIDRTADFYCLKKFWKIFFIGKTIPIT
jgi:hypothetical protein